MIFNQNSPATKHQLIGTKAANLLWLKQGGLPTPQFVVILLGDLIDNYDDLIVQLAEKFRHNDQQSIDALFRCVKWRENVLNEQFGQLKQFHQSAVSFRTSAAMEDLPGHSFAGLYETYLDVTFDEDNFRKYLGWCFRSLFSGRLFHYLQTNRLNPGKINFSVIIQQMFPAAVSGVAFTKYPSEAKLVIGQGLGKAIVDGSDACEIKIKKPKEIEVPSLVKETGCEKIFPQLIQQLWKITYLKKLGQDVEWSISRDGAAILQTRDITKPVDIVLQESVFDCTNISESYPGVVSPLTYSFIRFAYSKVYANFFRLIGVRQSKIHQKRPALENLLGYIKGRVYYRIENWYTMIETLPGYRYNKEFFESMLIPQKKLAPDKPTRKTDYLSLLRNFPLILRFCHKLLVYKKRNSHFLAIFEKKLAKHRRTDLSAMTAAQISDYYSTRKNLFLDDWKVPILNDFRLMIFHGILKKLVFKHVTNDPQLYLNQIMARFSGQNDYELIHEMKNLSRKVSQSGPLSKLFQLNDPTSIYAQLIGNTAPEYQQFRYMLDRYIQLYGDRRPDELVLESARLSDHPELIVQLIKHYSQLSENLENSKDAPRDLLAELKYNIRKRQGFLAGTISNHLLDIVIHYTRQSIRYRELFRMKRAQVYGIARDCFLALAEIFAASGIISQRDDVFYLTAEEILAISGNNCFESDFKSIISHRKKLMCEYEQQDKLPSRLKLYGIGPDAQIASDTETVHSFSQYQGLPTSQGITQGEVVIMKKFDPSIDVRNRIVVTYQTDPGWSLLFPLVKGIILEKGNSLSHAAILSRELGIPCVVKVGDIVEILHTGDIVKLDGNKGIVTIIGNS